MNQSNTFFCSRKRFCILFSLMLSLIFVRYTFQINITKVLFVLLSVLIVSLGDRDEAIAVLICCIPLHESIELFYTLVSCSAVYVVKFWKSMKINSIVIPVFFMLIWELLHSFDGDFSIKQLLICFIPMFVLTLIMSMDATTLDYSFIVRAFSISMLVVCLCVFGKLCYIYKFDIAAAVAKLKRLGNYNDYTAEQLNHLNVSGGDIQVNTMGILCVIAVTGLMQLRMSGVGKKSDMALMLTLLLFGTLTSSRTFLVCLAAMVMLLLFSQKGSLNRKFAFMARIIALILLVLILMWAFFPDVLTYFVSRFDTNDITTGRTGLLKSYHEFIFSDAKWLFFGVGFQNFSEKVLNVYNVARYVPHNGFQEAVVVWGLPGLLMFVLFLAALVLIAHEKNPKQILLNYIPLLIILLKVQAGQFLMSNYTMLMLSFAYLSLCCDMNLKKATQVCEKTSETYVESENRMPDAGEI